MNKRLLLSCFVLGCCIVANAHAPMYDRYLDTTINIEALVLVIAVIQLSTFLFLKYSKARVVCRYKNFIIRLAKRIFKRQRLRYGFAWALSSIVCTPYVYGFSIELAFFAFIPLLVFLLYYSKWVWNKEKRKKYLTGIKGLSKLLSVTCQQSLGYLIYALICETDTFHWFVYYTDEEYEMLDCKLYPGIEGFYYMAEGIVTIATITAIPYIVLFLFRVAKDYKVILSATRNDAQ